MNQIRNFSYNLRLKKRVAVMDEISSETDKKVAEIIKSFDAGMVPQDWAESTVKRLTGKPCDLSPPASFIDSLSGPLSPIADEVKKFNPCDIRPK